MALPTRARLTALTRSSSPDWGLGGGVPGPAALVSRWRWLYRAQRVAFGWQGTGRRRSGGTGCDFPWRTYQGAGSYRSGLAATKYPFMRGHVCGKISWAARDPPLDRGLDPGLDPGL